MTKEIENADYPKWIRYFVKLARPGVMIGMFSLLIFGGLFLTLVEFISPGNGEMAMRFFVEFLAAIDDQYYETLRFMFGAYVAGRSGQVIAENIARARDAARDAAAQYEVVEEEYEGDKQVRRRTRRRRQKVDESGGKQAYG